MPDAFEKLQQLVFDENKVVTYKTLCRSLNISANEAKGYLSEFLEKYRGKQQLSAHHFLLGSCSTPSGLQGLKALLVSDDELEKAKSEFITVTSVHVYGVHLGKLADVNVLYNVDYKETEHVEDYNRFSAIKNPHIHVQTEQRVKITATSSEGNKSQKPAASSSEIPSKHKVEKNTSGKNKAPNLFSLFPPKKDGESDTSQQKAHSKQSTTNSPPKKDVANKTGNTSNKSGVKYFFAKQAEQCSKNEVKSSETKDKKEDKDANTFSKVKSSPDSVQAHQTKSGKSPEITSSVSSPSKRKKDKPGKNKKKSKRQTVDDSDDDDFKPVKKRGRRIMTFDDSESENDQEKEDRAQREMFEGEPEISGSMMSNVDDEIIPPTPPVSNGKKRKWKSVARTFEDADGFLVTKTEKQLFTDSEDSNDKPAATEQQKPKSTTKKSPKSSPVKKKQASLMSFFGKNK